MTTRCRLGIAVSLVAVWVLGGAAPARAQADTGAILAAWAEAMGAVVEQEVSMLSLGGPTGIVSMPNAITMAAGEWQAALSYQGMRASSSDMYQAPDDLSVWSLQAARRLNDTAEVWATYSSAADHEGSRDWGLGAKKMLMPLEGLEGEGPFAAVGASYHRWSDAFPAGSWMSGDARPDASVAKAYGVVTGVLAHEEWSYGLLGSGGLMYIGLDPDRGQSRSVTRPFVGLQVVWVGTVLGLEYRWQDASLDARPVFSAAIRQVLSDEVTAELGTTNASPVGTGLSAQRLFLRLSHTFY